MEMTKASEQVLQGLTKDELGLFLREAGYHCADAGNTLESAVSGLRFGIALYGVDRATGCASSLQFICGMRAGGEQYVAQRANRWNRERRFPKLFVDDDGDVIATMDFHIRGVTNEYLSHVLRHWAVALGQMRQEF